MRREIVGDSGGLLSEGKRTSETTKEFFGKKIVRSDLCLGSVPSPSYVQYVSMVDQHAASCFIRLEGKGFWCVLTWSWYARLTNGVTQVRDIGRRCEECQREFLRVGDTMFIRRGGGIELRYREHCFSGSADPRTEGRSSFTTL